MAEFLIYKSPFKKCHFKNLNAKADKLNEDVKELGKVIARETVKVNRLIVSILDKKGEQ